MNHAVHAATDRLEPEEQGRADVYALLASLLLGVDAEVLGRLRRSAAADADDEPLACAWSTLVQRARAVGDASIAAEYAALFHAAGTPRVNPYGSRYLAGALMDKPLAALRSHLRRLGLARVAGATELEDHLGGLCEAMRLLIVRGTGLDEQQAFFARHLQGWYGRCLDDIAAACPDGFYAAVAAFACAFLDLEAAAFELAAADLHEPA